MPWSRFLPKVTPEKSLMRDDDKYKKFIRSMMRGLAHYIIGSLGARPASEAVDWLGSYMVEQQFQVREIAFKEACLKLCPECPGDDHKGCPAASIRELHAEDVQLHELVRHLFRSNVREITVKDVLRVVGRGTVFVVTPDDYQIEDLVIHEGKRYRVIGVERFPRMPKADIGLVVREVTLPANSTPEERP